MSDNVFAAVAPVPAPHHGSVKVDVVAAAPAPFPAPRRGLVAVPALATRRNRGAASLLLQLFLSFPLLRLPILQRYSPITTDLLRFLLLFRVQDDVSVSPVPVPCAPVL